MAKQHYQDILAFLELDSAEQFSYMSDGSIAQLYHDAEVSMVFLEIDAGGLRAKAPAVSIPPPGFEPQQPAGDVRDGDGLGFYK
eukprot:5001730-Pyramimonas_sp.AAC.1